MKLSKDLGKAMAAIDVALGSFDLPTSAMAVSAVAGVFAAQGKNSIHRAAGLGANIETMVSAYNETIANNSKKRARKSP